MFADFFSGEDDSLLSSHESDAGDEEFAGHDEGDKPDGEKAGAEKSYEGDCDEKFVGERIEEASEIGFDFPEAGEMAVEPIGDGGGHEKNDGEPGGPKGYGRMGAGLEENEEHERGDHAAHGEPVGKSHFQ